MPKLKHGTLIPTDKEDMEITAAALNDPDAQPLSDEQFARMKPFKSVFGRPKAAVTKISTTVRFDPDILDYFKSTGAGWQSRMNDALKQWVHEHK